MRGELTKVCVVGLGPAGIAAALLLSKQKSIALTCLEAGNPPKERACTRLENEVCHKEEYCQIICGFGGCAFLNGGKISDFPAGEGLISVYGTPAKTKKALHQALKEISQYIAFEKSPVDRKAVKMEQDYFNKLGFNYKYYNAYLCEDKKRSDGLEKIYGELVSTGALFLFKTNLVRIQRNGRGFDLTVNNSNGFSIVHADYVILAVGRSGKEIINRVVEDLELEGKDNSVDVGVRLEFPTKLFPTTTVHNDLKLKFNRARTFCVCKDGHVIEYYVNGLMLTEGCCSSIKSGFTNLGITIRWQPSTKKDGLQEDFREQFRRLYNGKTISQGLDMYLSPYLNSDSLFGKKYSTNTLLPEPFAIPVMEAVYYFSLRLLPKERWQDVTVFAPELDFGGVSLPLDKNFSVAPNIYLIGDCTGRFRGILQAWSSGRTAAKKILGECNENHK